jgi:Flp pilus assembly protein TadG
VRRKKQRGNTVIEATLILMLFLTILFGCFDFGLALFQYQTLVHQARVGARFGVIHPTNLTGIRNMVIYSSTSLPDGKTAGDPGVFGLTPAMVAVSRVDEGTPEDRIVISLSNYRVIFVGPYLAGSFLGKPIHASLPVEAQ